MRRLALLAALTLACGHGLGDVACSADRDCPSPQSCVAGHCASVGFCVGSAACNNDAACGAGQHCANGCCQPGDSGACARDADCSSHPKTPVCDTAKGACVACLTARDCGRGFACENEQCVALAGCSKDTDCPTATPRCDTQLNSCVECLSSSDCLNLSRPSCSADHTCVAVQACTGDGQCAKPTPRCLVSGGRCVACLTNADCVAPMQCDQSHNVCLQPSATSCTNEAGCASNAVDPHCLPGSNGKPGVCVQCLNDGQCQAGQVCDSTNTCVQKTCAADGDCAAPTPRCDLTDTPHLCVQCLANTDCGGGGTCQANHTCSAPAGCASDKDCAQNVANPHCNTTTGACVQCVQPADCGAGKTCAQNVCVQSACKSDNDCSSLPATPHCDTGTGNCVQCTAATQCPQGDKCASDTCAPLCTTATQSTDCPAATPYCRVSPFPQCVQCLSSSQCGTNFVCDSTDSCVPQPGCTSGANCPSGAPVCLGGNCVQCASDADCHNGAGCDTSKNTCTLTGGQGEICSPGNVCNAGLLCMNLGGANGPVCLSPCNPYSPSCGAGTVCRWYGFDSSNAFAGVCAPPNGHAQLGQARNPNAADSCEWNLICAPGSDSTGLCSAMCDPAASGACGANACNPVTAALSGSTQLRFGYCGLASTWGSPCITDTPSSGLGNCGSPVPSTSPSDLYCAPSTLIADSSQTVVLGLCTFTPSAATAVGGAGDSCATNTDLDCRTGICLTDGPVTCFAGCGASADCARDWADNHATAEPSMYCVDVDFYTGRDNIIGACEPTCRDDADCAALGGTQGRACVPSPIHGNYSWRSFCAPVQGSGAPGAHCTGGSDCGSGACVTAATLQRWELQQAVAGFTATDGFCLGAAYQAADCAAAGTGLTSTVALPLDSPTTEGVMGVPHPGVCWPQSCTRDANCSGLSADANTPRVCAPYKLIASGSASTQSTPCSATRPCAGSIVCNDSTNNPNPGGAYGTTGGIFGPNGYCRQESWALQCAPSLGAAKGGPGAACTYSTDCRTGHCLVQSGVANYCFGGCSADSDCAAGTTCKAGTYLAMSLSFCQP